MRIALDGGYAFYLIAIPAATNQLYHTSRFLRIIKHESVAQIFDVLADGYMIGRGIICCQRLTNLIGRSQITDVVHKELAQTLQD